MRIYTSLYVEHYRRFHLFELVWVTLFQFFRISSDRRSCPLCFRAGLTLVTGHSGWLEGLESPKISWVGLQLDRNSINQRGRYEEPAILIPRVSLVTGVTYGRLGHFVWIYGGQGSRTSLSCKCSCRLDRCPNILGKPSFSHLVKNGTLVYSKTPPIKQC